MNAAEPIADAVAERHAGRSPGSDPAIDPSGHTAEEACLNCGTMLLGKHCHSCGQKGHVHRSLAAFGHDLAHGVFHFEGKVWTTLPMLLLRPGDLTRRYIAGERATFVSPLALFLFGVFLMFAVVSWAGGFHVDAEKIKAGAEQSARLGEEEIARLEKLRARALAVGDAAAAAKLASDIEEERDIIAITDPFGMTAGQDDLLVNVSGDGSIRVGKQAPTAIDRLNDAYKAAKKNPELMLFKLKSNGYKYSWALIPLSLPLMWLLFPFSRRYRMYDHAVFVTYSLCFVTFLVVAGSLLALAGITAGSLLALLIPFHMYRQLRGAYLLSRPSALWRALLLTVGSFLIALVFTFGIAVLGLYD